MNLALRCCSLFLLTLISPRIVCATQPQHPQDVPAIDGEAGPCSVEITVTDADTKAVYDATVKVHIAFGFAGVRKLDLEAGTNVEGKVVFKGLPVKVHKPLPEFRATKDQQAGTATYDPAAECQAKRNIVLQKAAGKTNTP
jgi:hypothetical protein